MVFSIDDVVQGMLSESFSPGSVEFWEGYTDDGEILYEGRAGHSTYKVRVPDSEHFLVVKPKDTKTSNDNDPRKTAIFQELTKCYGAATVPEVTVERNGKAVRLSGYVHAIHLASSINEGNRDHLQGSDRELVEQWFPEDIFDDYMEVQRHSQGTTWYTDYIHKLTLNIDKFRAWYGTDGNDQKEKVRASLQGIYEMVNDGLLFDLYGILNLAFHDAEFVLVDVEPLQLSNVKNFKPATVGYPEDLLNNLFSVVGLPQISYNQIVKGNYGEDKFLEIRTKFNPMAASGQHRTLHTNVTNDEELRLYEQRFFEKGLTF